MKIITPTELKKHLDKTTAILIDVREPAEHRSEHIEGAHLIPLKEVAAEKLPQKSDYIVIYCQSGRRSTEACKKLLKQNPTLNIYSLEGGIAAWKQAGFSVNKSPSKVLPLDQQTQLAAGFLALLGVLLGTYIHSGFYVIPGFVGSGLMFAGVTGWCGMAKLLAKMPWNQ